MRNRVTLLVGILAAFLITGLPFFSSTIGDAMRLAGSGHRWEGFQLARLWLSQWSAVDKLALGKFYLRNSTIPSNREIADKWLLAAAKGGNADAQHLIGVAYHKGDGVPPDDSVAANWLRRAAEQGVPAACYDLAMLYARGSGVPKSQVQSFAWANKSAAMGYAKGEYTAGYDYLNGIGVAKDTNRAAQLITHAANNGLTMAQDALAVLYQDGTGVPQDYATAAKWLTKAADAGDAAANFNLGAMYFEGQGVPKNGSKGFKLFLRSAEGGNARALYVLGTVYKAGSADLMLNRDYVQAYAYYDIAGANGDAQAAPERNALARDMTPAQIQLAQHLASTWTVGSKLPFLTQLEDRAPQYLLAKGFPPSLLAKTRVWFQHDFKAGKFQFNYRTVFLATKGSDCHACEATISAVTFQGDDAIDFPEMVQTGFTQLGEWGSVEDLKASKLAPGGGLVMARAGGGELLFIPESDGGQGITDHYFEMLNFQQKSGWRFVGWLSVGEDNSGTCGESGNIADNPSAQPCYKWSGSVVVSHQSQNGLPILLVKTQGSTWDPNSPPSITKNMPAPDLTYTFNGAKYVQAKTNAAGLAN